MFFRFAQERNRKYVFRWAQNEIVGLVRGQAGGADRSVSSRGQGRG
jgi:hypothetical protein